MSQQELLTRVVTALESCGIRQHQDALRVYEIQFAELDQAYLDQWAQQLGASDLLARVRAEAQVV